MIKNLPANAGNVGSISASGRSPGVGNGNPLQYSCLENPMIEELGLDSDKESKESVESQRVRHTHNYT